MFKQLVESMSCTKYQYSEPIAIGSNNSIFLSKMITTAKNKQKFSLMFYPTTGVLHANGAILSTAKDEQIHIRTLSRKKYHHSTKTAEILIE